MKTNIFNITALVLMVTSSFIVGKTALSERQLELPSEAITELADFSSCNYTMVEAKIIDGEVVPFVTLPELDIVASYNDDKMVSAKIVDGEVMAFVQLPELSIESN